MILDLIPNTQEWTLKANLGKDQRSIQQTQDSSLFIQELWCSPVLFQQTHMVHLLLKIKISRFVP